MSESNHRAKSGFRFRDASEFVARSRCAVLPNCAIVVSDVFALLAERLSVARHGMRFPLQVLAAIAVAFGLAVLLLGYAFPLAQAHANQSHDSYGASIEHESAFDRELSGHISTFAIATQQAAEGTLGHGVISKDMTVADEVTYDGNVYIEQGCALTIAGTVTVNGDIYVFGTLVNTGKLTVNGTLNALHYGSMFSAGDYDFGFVQNSGSIKVIKLNVKDDYLSQPVPVVEHAWGAWTVAQEPTCTEPGSRERTCVVCGLKETEMVANLGHLWNAGVITSEPTCEKPGVKTFTCTRDASHTEIESVDSLGHEWSNWEVVVPAGSKTEGLEQRVCAHDATHIESQVVPATGESVTAVSDSTIKSEDSVGGYTPTVTPGDQASGSVVLGMVEAVDGTTDGVTAIAAHAFKGTKVVKFTVVGDITTIGKEAFAGAKNLRTFTVGKNVTAIGKAVFKGCPKLKTLTVKSSKLTKASCKRMLKGSSVTKVKLAGMTKVQKKKTMVKYRAWFPKKINGKKLVLI